MDELKEEWKPVEGYEERYEVSNLGRVRSLDMNVVRGSRSGRKYLYKQKGRIIKQTKVNGYPAFTIINNKGEKKTVQVHRLVAKAFVEGYKEGLQVNHIDETRDNNRADNLEWITCKQNLNHGTRNKRLSITKGKSVVQLTLKGKVVNTFFSLAEACRQTGICRENIGKCCNHKKCWRTAGGYRWEFV